MDAEKVRCPKCKSVMGMTRGIKINCPTCGELLDFLPIPTDEVTNCAFGGEDRKTLFATGGGVLYSIRVTTPGRVVWPK